jgi:hypothetical protein
MLFKHSGAPNQVTSIWLAGAVETAPDNVILLKDSDGVAADTRVTDEKHGSGKRGDTAADEIINGTPVRSTRSLCW